MSYDRLTFPSFPAEPSAAPRTSYPAAGETSFAALYSEAMQAAQIASVDSPDSSESTDDWMNLIQLSSGAPALGATNPLGAQIADLSALRGELMQHVDAIRSTQGQVTTLGGIDKKTPATPAEPIPAPAQPAEGKLPSGVHRLISWIDTHAHLHSTHHCAASVRQAMEAAGMQTADRPVSGDAGDYGPFLLRHGAEVVSSDSYQPKAGDIAVFDRTQDHPAGHIQVFDGQHWVSDFMQNTFSPYKDQSSTPPVTVYRLS